MLLTTPTRSPIVDVLSTAPTVVEPGERFKATVRASANQECDLLALTWEAPKALTILSTSQSFPVHIASGQAVELQCSFSTDPEHEDFGEMCAHLKVKSTSGEETTVSWTAWISVFPRRRAENPDHLEDDLRQRLIDVVNAHPRNGHIFLADYRGFFEDFLNVQIADHIAATLSEEFDLRTEGHPLDSERREMVILGQMAFLGIVKMEVQAQEYCTESDDRYDAEDAREIKREEDDDA